MAQPELKPPYRPHPDNPYPIEDRNHWKWFHANDPRAKQPRDTTTNVIDKFNADAAKRASFFGGGKPK